MKKMKKMNFQDRKIRNRRWTPLLVILSFFLMSASYAQKIQLTEGMVNHNGVEQASIIATIEPPTKAIKEALKDWMKEEHEVDLKGYGFLTNKATLSAEGVIIPEISKKRIDFFAKVTKEGNKSEMQVFSSFGPEVPINAVAYPTAYAALQNLTLDFLDDFLPKWYRSRIAEAQEVVSDLRRERENLMNDKQDNQEEMRELQEELTEVEQDLDEAESELNKDLNTLHEVGHKLKNSRRSLSYIVVLDASYFPSLKFEEDSDDRSARKDPASMAAYEKRVEKHLHSFAKDELGIKPKQITQIYSGTLLGFAVQIDEKQKDQFLKKAEKLEAIERVEKDQKVGIF